MSAIVDVERVPEVCPLFVTGRTRVLMVAVPSAVMLVLAVWALDFGLPWLLRPDEDVIVGRAVAMAVHGTFDPRFHNWPPLFFYVVAAALKTLAALGFGTLAGAMSDPSAAYLTARALSAGAAVAAVAAITRAGDLAFGRGAGLTAGLLLAASPLVVRQAHSGTADTLQLAFVCAAIWLALGADGTRRFAAAGACCGLAAASKYLGGLVLLFVVAQSLRSERDGWRNMLAASGAALGVFALAMLPNASHMADYARGILFLHARAGQYYGHLAGWFAHPLRSFPYGFGLGAYALALAGLVFGVLRRDGTVLGLLAFFLVYYVLIARTQEVFFRYTLPLLPVLALFGARAITAIPRPTWVRATAFTIFLAPSIVASTRTDWLLSQTDTRRQAAEWMLQHLPAGTAIGEYNYWGQIFYDERGVRANPLRTLYRTGDPLIDAHQQGRYTDRFVIRPGARIRVIETPAPLQAPAHVFRGDITVLARFLPYHRVPVNAVYEPDSFYLPYWGFRGLDRPGPSIAIVRLPPAP